MRAALVGHYLRRALSKFDHDPDRLSLSQRKFRQILFNITVDFAIIGLLYNFNLYLLACLELQNTIMITELWVVGVIIKFWPIFFVLGSLQNLLRMAFERASSY